MNGTIEKNGNTYWWWAGPANTGAKEDFCVHCRGTTFGVTEYMDSDPTESDARAIAERLVPKVDSVS